MSTTPAIKKRLGRPPAVENPRQRILDRAAELFAEKGYDGASVADLAALMGVSKAAVFHYFQTKQQIYDAIMLQTLQGLVQTVSAQVDEETTAPAKLRRFMVAHARYFEAHRPCFVMMLAGFGGMNNAGDREAATRLRDQYEQMLRDIIAQGIASGAFRAARVATTARAVLSMLNWMARWFRPGAESSAEDIALEYHALLTAGLEKPTHD